MTNLCNATIMEPPRDIGISKTLLMSDLHVSYLLLSIRPVDVITSLATLSHDAAIPILSRD